MWATATDRAQHGVLSLLLPDDDAEGEDAYAGVRARVGCASSPRALRCAGLGGVLNSPALGILSTAGCGSRAFLRRLTKPPNRRGGGGGGVRLAAAKASGAAVGELRACCGIRCKRGLSITSVCCRRSVRARGTPTRLSGMRRNE